MSGREGKGRVHRDNEPHSGAHQVSVCICGRDGGLLTAFVPYSELQALDSELHLFCPRTGEEDGSLYFDEDLAGQPQSVDDDAATVAHRKRLVKEARERRWVALDALQVLAFDGEDAQPYKAWIKDRLDALMTSCDVCVRVFHQSRAEWKIRLVDQYDEDNKIGRAHV